ncbi:MAG TPA: PVC-type heme-binding CxxCH protein, partial [Lacipirellulaceae bacterium]
MRCCVTVFLMWSLATHTLARAQGFSPADAERRITALEGIKVKIFAAEPNVRQAIFVKCDDRGRLWTIQYLQYPNPAGLERVKVDRWSRTVYDRAPEPPPRGPRGADKITILTDTDGDGRADEFKDFIDGLNLVTGVEFGYGGVYVLQVPYLLFYPDRNRDDVPDDDPEVLLTGFGMEDAQAVANHLTWGPDGWLYGVNGSTTTCRIRGIEFQQGCWRYHPRTKEFELFCEGGLNCYGLTFDANGELFYSTNGGPFVHAVQGGYFYKSFGKHGPLHNLFAYHYFPQQECDQVPGGPPTGGTIYLGDVFPDQLRGTFVAGNFLGHTISWWNVTPNGSTVRATHGGVLFDTHDTWSGPTDFCVGPDGCAYVSDFYDKRTAHPDPDANWDRSNGRIYRVEPSAGATPITCNLAQLTSNELVDLLLHENRWFADRARVELASRRDMSIVPRLREAAKQTKNTHHALQGLWGIAAAAELDDDLAIELLAHPYPSVRFWTVRLLGDRKTVSSDVAEALLRLAEHEQSPVVLAQLAASAKRLPGSQGLPLVEALLDRQAGNDDPRVPWLIWWAIEAHAMTDTSNLLAMFSPASSWATPMCRDNGLRLLRRWAADGTHQGYSACRSLLRTAPADHQIAAFQAIRDGLAERSQGFEEITQGGLFDKQATEASTEIKRSRRSFAPVDGELRAAILKYLDENPADHLALELALRASSDEAYDSLLQLFSDASQPEQRLKLLALLREFGQRDAVPVVLPLVDGDTPADVLQAALDVLVRFDEPAITDHLLREYSHLPPDLRAAVRNVLFARPVPTLAFLQRVDRGEFPTEEVPVDQLRHLANHHSESIDALVRKHWGNLAPGTSEERLATMRRYSNDLRAAPGNPDVGKKLFTKHCATCHKLHGEGENIGPDLTIANRQDQAALLANVVDPSAVIRREYTSYIVVTISGRVITGLIAEQDAASVTVITAEAKRIKLSRDEIDEITESDTSQMPEKILETLSPQELR